MSTVPAPQREAVAAVYAWYESQAGDHRPHLGASLIGHACERALWLTFRWAEREQFDGRMRRLLDTGQRAELRFVQELRAIGCEVHDTSPDGGQWRVSAVAGHFGGSMDAAVKGIPEAPKTWHVAEFKTHNAKSFKALQSKGVEATKPMHYAQMQVYMGLTGMDRAFYLAENKDDSSIYSERVEFDPDEFERLMARAARVIAASEPPARVGSDVTHPDCKYCGFSSLCHGETAPEANCRTCVHSTPDRKRDDGVWSCDCDARPLSVIPLATQRVGCAGHRYIPILLERIGEAIDSDGDSVTYRRGDRTFVNGPRPGFSSAEIRACFDKRLLTDDTARELLSRFKTATVVA